MRDGTSVAPILIWFGVGIALLAALELIGNPFVALMLFPLAALIYLGVAVALLVAYLRNALKERSKRSWIAAASIPALIAVLVLIWPLIAKLVLYAEFAVMLPEYSRIVEAVAMSSEPASGTAYIVDSGPSVRVAFPEDGIIDNWWGIVYDSSDAVAQARGWSFDNGQQQFTAPPEIKALFGGDLLSCWRLYRHYYACSFT